MSKVKFYATQYPHLRQLADSMRQEDAAECEAQGFTPLRALEKSFFVSRDTTSAYAEGRILAILGVRPYSLLTERASPWLLTSQSAIKYPRDLLRYSRQHIERWKRQYSVLENDVDARYTQALCWVKWLGFEVGEPRPLGKLGMLFCHVEIRR